MLLYNLTISLYFALIRLFSLFNSKARLLIAGQSNWKLPLENAVKSFGNAPLIWIHCASVGEFEQGRPLIESIKEKHPNHKILLSFFSPSGYEMHKNYKLADHVTYLPFDKKRNVRRFIESSKPKAVIFVKYEFWLNYLFELKKQGIPTFLVSAVIKKHQPFFKWYGKPFVKALQNYRKIFVQDGDSLELLESLGASNGEVFGDTRIDRVIAVRDRSGENELVKGFCSEEKIIIAGSTWSKDENVILKSFVHLKEKKYNTLKLVLVPHEVDEKNISRLEKDLSLLNLKYARYTTFKEVDKNADILVVDTIGMLSSIYKYGQIAYIGGGFDGGIHNILEPAVFGLPVIFGPNHQKFNEAARLLKLGAATEIKEDTELSEILEKYLNSAPILDNASQIAHAYVNANKGATEKILKQIPFD
jgi:3-deoxy-D-manno-octulosonic-acid transferase